MLWRVAGRCGGQLFSVHGTGAESISVTEPAGSVSYGSETPTVPGAGTRRRMRVKRPASAVESPDL